MTQVRFEVDGGATSAGGSGGQEGLRTRLLSTNTNETSGTSPPTSAAGLHLSGSMDAEILSVTPDHHNPFKVGIIYIT